MKYADRSRPADVRDFVAKSRRVARASSLRGLSFLGSARGGRCRSRDHGLARHQSNRLLHRRDAHVRCNSRISRRRIPSLVHAVTFFAALTDFSEAGDIGALLGSDADRNAMEEDMDARGVYGGEPHGGMRSIMLRSNDLIWNVAINRYLLGKAAPAFDLLFWNDDATAMPAAMHSYYSAKHVRSATGSPRANSWCATCRSTSARSENDTYLVASIEDHIAPWKAVYKMTAQFRRATCGSGSGIPVTSRASSIAPASGKGRHWEKRRDARPKPAEWLSRERSEQAGSWWPDWLGWITARSGARSSCSALGGRIANVPRRWKQHRVRTCSV